MRIAFFSPLPPAKSGIADYSAALIPELQKHLTVEPFSSRPEHFDPGAFDSIVYQLGNNPHHDFVYETALAHPGIIVLHEANLHHLIADLTIRKNDWGAYWHEVEYNSGLRGEHPDYRLPLLRSILERSKGVIVHSATVEHTLRSHGYNGPIARIPHGAQVTVESNAEDYRKRLGIIETMPLFGIFGFLKPYKRIRESLRAFKRVIAQHPRARLLLVGELHPEISLDLPAYARHIDYASPSDFEGYMNACDVILNLRYPTVGESSGTQMRAMGMGKPVLVSDVGSFAEFPDSVCLKVPVNLREEDYLAEYMCLLADRAEVRNAIGERARDWVKSNCTWEMVAGKYAEFIAKPDRVSLRDQAPYVEQHRTRLERILALTPPGGPKDAVLEMGTYLHLPAALKIRGYGDVRGTYLGKAGKTEQHNIVLPDRSTFVCPVSHFDAERDFFPYPSAHFSTVLCCELLEHLAHDPMFMMEQIHRILRPGGVLLLTTPNLASLRAIEACLQGSHPMLFPSYIKSAADPRHTREYTPNEIRLLLENCGLEVTHLETGPFRDAPTPQLGWVEHLLDAYHLPQNNRGEGIYALARKIGPVRERYPGWLYA